MAICPNCGEDNPERASFCMVCATPLRTAVAPAKRRTATILFSDLVGSTSLGERLDAEALREVLDRYFSVLRERIDHHGGTVEKYIGDAIMAVFGLRGVREDDPLRAVLAAWDIRSRMAGLNEDLEERYGVRLTNRTGVFTGEVITGDPALGQRLVTGDAVNTAARLEQAAPPNEILIGELTHHLVDRFVDAESRSVEAKGKAEPVRAFQVLGVSTTHERIREREPRLVGRTAELATLEASFGRVVREERCGLAVVVGDPGAGKSRLAREFLARLPGGVETLSARCTRYDEGEPLRPLVEVARRALGIDPNDPGENARRTLAIACEGAPNELLLVERLGAALGLSPPGVDLEEMLWAIGRLLVHLAGTRPLVVVLDDTQWADPVVVDWIRRITTISTGGPFLLLCLARPDPTGEADGFADVTADKVVLEPLPADSVRDLIEAALYPGAIPEGIVEPVQRASVGNPLFVQQILAMWRDDGVLVERDHRWILTVASPDLRVPPTIDALLSDRLDRLGEPDRTVVERASIVGESFGIQEIGALMEGRLDEIESVLTRLEERDVLRRPEPGSPDAWAFAHILLRDATYGSILKRARSDLHRRLADWFERSSSDEGSGRVGPSGYHLEQAFLLRQELGPPDDETLGIGRRAADALVAQARLSLDAADVESASRLYERAASTIPGDDGPRLRLLVAAAEETSEPRRLAQLERAAREVPSGVDQSSLAARLSVLSVKRRLESGASPALLADLHHAISRLEQLDDGEALAHARAVEERTYGWLGRGADARRAMEAGLEAARRAGRSDLASGYLATVGMIMVFDPTPADEALAFCEAALEEHRSDRLVGMELLRPLSIFRAMRGDLDGARAALRTLRSLADEFPSWSQDVAGWEARAIVEGLVGDIDAEEDALRRAYDLMIMMDDVARAVSIVAVRAGVAVTRGEPGAAVSLTEESERLAAPDDYDAQTRWRSARARAFALLGRGTEAQTLARDAAEIAAGTDDINLRADALCDLAAVLEDRAEADAALETAISLYGQKGNLASQARAGSRSGRSRSPSGSDP